MQGESISATSDELTAGVGSLKISDYSPVFSPETDSTVSSSGEGNGSFRLGHRPRDTLNAFLKQCQIQSLERPWM